MMWMIIICFGLLVQHCLSGCGAEDSTLNIEKKCGEAYKITMTYDSMQRELYMYIPTIFCDENEFIKHANKRLNNKNTPFDPKIHQMTIPMLLSIHCLGGNAKMELRKWQSYAEQHTFILITPEGIGNSWNADQCCDPAVENDVDDLGFIQTIINGAQTSFSGIFPFATVRNKNYDGYLWINGFSNGGFMSDKIAWISTIDQFSKVVAVAPMAGYIYDNSKYIKNAKKNNDKHNKVAMYFHHSASDIMVNPNGCCMDSKQGCCCHIADKSSHCLSIYDEYSNWLQWNGCNKDIKFDDIAINKTVDGSRGHINAKCAYATPDEHGCDVYTHLCMYEKTAHAEWSRFVPQNDDIMMFFLKSLCLQQNGKFNDVMIKCECDENSNFAGFNCISPKRALGLAETLTVVSDVKNDKPVDSGALMNEKKVGKKDEIVVETPVGNNVLNVDGNEMDNKQEWHDVVRNGKVRQFKRNKGLSVLGSADKYDDKTFELHSVSTGNGIWDWDKMPNTSIVLICTMLFASIGLFVMYKKKQAGYRYSKVKLDDDENETVNNALIDNC